MLSEILSKCAKSWNFECIVVAAPVLSQEEARLCDMIIDRMEAGGLNPQAAMLLVSMYACSAEERVMRSEVNKYVC